MTPSSVLLISAINPAVRQCVTEFLKSIENIKLGEREPGAVIQERKVMACSVRAFVVRGS